MKTLRWKPLKSSVKTARAITGILEIIAVLLLVLCIIAAIVSASNGTAGFITGLIFVITGIVSYIFFKATYIALELLTEIADDTRLQLLAIAGDEYDQLIESNQSAESPQTPLVDSDEMRRIFDAAVSAYKRDGGKKKCSFEDSSISPESVILRDAGGWEIKKMSFYDGEWIRE